MLESAVTHQFRELREEISLLRDLIEPKLALNCAPVRIRVQIERAHGERRPFMFIFKAPAEKRIRMSATRAAITLTLLLDLERRSQGHSGLSTRELVVEALRVLAPAGDRDAVEVGTKALEQVRVALYRFSQFWEEELSELIPLTYDSVEERLVLPAGGACEIQIISNDPRLEDALPSLGRLDMLERLRRDRFLFVPSGGGGAERFLTEIYGSTGTVSALLAYYRPQLITVPPQLMQKYGSPEAALRHSLMHQRLHDGTLTFTEIVPAGCLEMLATPGSDGSYTYFPGMSKPEVLEHLEFLDSLVASGCGYRLLLTEGEIPFYVGVYKALSAQLVAFFRLPEGRAQSSWSSFAVWGMDVCRMAEASVFEWLLNHPSTVTDPEAVRGKIHSALEALQRGKR